MPLVLVVVSGLLGSLFGLGYKYKTRYPSDPDGLIVVLSGSASLLALLCIPIFHEPLLDREALIVAVPFGVASYISTLLYLLVIERAQLNVTWTVIQFFVVIPFVVSVVGYGERLDLLSVLGIILIFLSILLFGRGHARPRRGSAPARSEGGPAPSEAPAAEGIGATVGEPSPSGSAGTPGGSLPGDRRARGRIFVALLLSTLFSGIGNTFPKVYEASVASSHPFALLFWANLAYLATALVVAAGRGRLARLSLGGPTLAIGSWMGITSVIGMTALTVALGAIGGSIAYPVRSVINIVAIYLLSFALFRERITVVESVGAAAALAGVALVSSSL